jgi:hypothetical protein
VTLLVGALASVLLGGSGTQAASGTRVALGVVGPVTLFAGGQETTGDLPLALDLSGCSSGRVEVRQVDGGIEANLSDGVVAGAGCLVDVIVSAPGPSIELSVPELCEATTPVVFSTSISGSVTGGAAIRLVPTLASQKVLTSTLLGGLMTTPDFSVEGHVPGSGAIPPTLRLSTLVHLLPGDLVGWPGLGSTGLSVQNPQTWFLYAELKSDAPGTFEQILRLEAFLPPGAGSVSIGPDPCRKRPPPRGGGRGHR